MNFFIPPAAAPRQYGCPIHGQHGKWIESEIVTTGQYGMASSFRLCGLCTIQMLRQIGYTITEPETLKEGDWVLDELPEIEK